MEMKEVIDKINSLNATKRERELTNMRNILDNTKVINENGEDITPKKKGD